MCSKKYCDYGEKLLHGAEGSLYKRFDDFKVGGMIDSCVTSGNGCESLGFIDLISCTYSRLHVFTLIRC